MNITTLNDEARNAIVRELGCSEDDYKAAKSKFEEAFADNPSYATEWYLDDVIMAEAKMRLAITAQLVGESAEESELTLEERCSRVVQTLEDTVWRIRGASRSSSTSHRYVEDLRVEALMSVYGKVLEALRYG